MILKENKNDDFNEVITSVVAFTVVLALALSVFLLADNKVRRNVMRSIGIKPEFSRDLYYLNENIEFSDAEDSVKDKVNPKAYWIRKEVAEDYTKYKDSAELITESNGFLLFNPIVKDEPFKASLSNTNSNIERSSNSELAGE